MTTEPRPSATILIAARNAAATITHAVRSAVAQGPYPLLLIDDHSGDDTVAVAQAVAGPHLRVVRPPDHGPLGATRQAGLLAVETPYAAWLDADDEFLPGRLPRLLKALADRDGDIAVDAADLADDGHTEPGDLLGIPTFLTRDPWLARQFERNYLPAPGAIVFRTDALRALGYDTTLHGAEDMDVILRAAMAGARFVIVPEPGYRIHALPGSQSRQIENQRLMYGRALRKHEYESVEALLARAGYGARIAMWALVSMAAFREDVDEALAWLDRIEALGGDAAAIEEPDGPSPFPEAWRIAFWRGTLLLETGQFLRARTCLARAEALRPSPEGANNLGVAELLAGRADVAGTWFNIATARAPHYRDALLNLHRPGDVPRITTHPFRVQPNRTDYQVGPSVGPPPACHPRRRARRAA